MIPTRFCPVCGAVNDEADAHCFACGLELADDAQSGSAGQGTLLHARYRVGSSIGSGGYSAVYRGWDTQEGGRAVAIKQITLHGLDTEATIEAKGQLKPFKNGAFRLAIENQVPVVPITYLGNWKLLQNGGFFKASGRPGMARVVVHAPVSTKGMTEEDLVPLRHRVRETIAQTLRQQ